MPVSKVPSGLSILIVEDEFLIREMGISLFQDLGFVVYSAAHGGEALEILKAHPSIKLMFTDVRMPVMMGDELVREAVKLRPDLKVVFTSGYTSNNRISADFPMVQKPYRPRDVIQAFMGLLDNPSDMAPDSQH